VNIRRNILKTPEDGRYEAAKKFADIFGEMPKLWQKVLGELLIVGSSPDEIAERLGQEVVRDEDGCPLATPSIDRVEASAYSFLLQRGYNRDEVADLLDAMAGYRL
jgi:hypothetical protein